MSAETQGNLIVLYKSADELRRDRQKLFDDLWTDLSKETKLLRATAPVLTPEMEARARAMADEELRKFGIARSDRKTEMLSKGVNDELKKEAARIDASEGIAVHFVRTTREIIERYKSEIDAHRRLEKRSERFLKRLGQ